MTTTQDGLLILFIYMQFLYLPLKLPKFGLLHSTGYHMERNDADLVPFWNCSSLFGCHRKNKVLTLAFSHATSSSGC